MPDILLYFELPGNILGLLQVVNDAGVVLLHILDPAFLVVDFVHLAHVDAVVAFALLQRGLAVRVQRPHTQG
jgi:hypothetical protein